MAKVAAANCVEALDVVDHYNGTGGDEQCETLA
jgi:hypothetical protein